MKNSLTALLIGAAIIFLVAVSACIVRAPSILVDNNLSEFGVFPATAFLFNSGLVVAGALLMTYVVILLFVLIKFGVFNPGMAKALFTILLEAMVLVSVAMLASVFYSPLVCVMLTALFYVVGHVKGDFLYRAMTDSANDPATRAISGVAYYVLPNLERLNINETIAHSERMFSVGATELLLLIGLAAAFTAILLFVGGYLFSRRDL